MYDCTYIVLQIGLAYHRIFYSIAHNIEQEFQKNLWHFHFLLQISVVTFSFNEKIHELSGLAEEAAGRLLNQSEQG